MSKGSMRVKADDAETLAGQSGWRDAISTGARAANAGGTTYLVCVRGVSHNLESCIDPEPPKPSTSLSLSLSLPPLPVSSLFCTYLGKKIFN